MGLATAPYYHRTTRQGVMDYFKEVAAGCEVGLCLYNYPSGVGFELEPEMIAELAQEPNIVALKDTADMEHTAETLAATRGMDFAVLQGFEHLMLPASPWAARARSASFTTWFPGRWWSCMRRSWLGTGRGQTS